MHTLSAEAARHAAFTTIRDTTLRALEHSALPGLLGNATGELHEEVENCFFVPRLGGKTVLPEKQIEEDNIGIHPILRRDLRLPNVQPFALRLSLGSYEELAKVTVAAPTKEIVGRRPYYPYGKSPLALKGRSAVLLNNVIHAVDVPDASAPNGTRQFVAMARPLIGTRRLEQLPPPRQAALLGHFINHVVSTEEVVSMRNRLVQGAGPSQHTPDRDLATIERSAYHTTQAILEAHDQHPAVPIKEVARSISSMQPEEAGRHLRSQNQDTPAVPRYVAAAALTETFGQGNTWATEEEAIAYKAAGLFH